MVTRDDLQAKFGDVKDVGDGVLRCMISVPARALYYYFRSARSAGDVDCLMVSQDRADDSFALRVLTSLADVPLGQKLLLRGMPGAHCAFPGILFVPPGFYSHLEGILDDRRDRLVWCVPAFVSEFSGMESNRLFREMCYRSVPVLNWTRNECPKVLVRFDNPRTGVGTGDEYVLSSHKELVREIELLTEAGFVEAMNVHERVIEILRQADGDDGYVLIRDRNDPDRRLLRKDVLLGEVWRFLVDPAW